MKKLLFRRWWTALMVGVVAAVAAACASSLHHEVVTAKKHLDDHTITASILTAYDADDDLGIVRVQVETHNGIVLLTGIVDSVLAARRAVEIATHIPGVVRVESYLLVITPDTPDDDEDSEPVKYLVRNRR